MSGRRIDDHSSWMGKGGKSSVLPAESKVQMMDSSMGAGALGKYEDTAESIKAVQAAGVAKINAHKQKDGYFH